MRPKSPFPKSYLHKPTNQDAVVVRDPDGKRRTIYLGAHGSAEAKQRCREMMAAHFSAASCATVG